MNDVQDAGIKATFSLWFIIPLIIALILKALSFEAVDTLIVGLLCFVWGIIFLKMNMALEELWDD